MKRQAGLGPRDSPFGGQDLGPLLLVAVEAVEVVEDAHLARDRVHALAPKHDDLIHFLHGKVQGRAEDSAGEDRGGCREGRGGCRGGQVRRLMGVATGQRSDPSPNTHCRLRT